MKTYSFYFLETGMFTGTHRNTTRSIEDLAVPPGCAAIEGLYDHLSQRIDIELVPAGERATSERVIEYQPDKPSAEHEWDVASKRWQLPAEAEERRIADQVARSEIESLEARQHRYVAEKLLGLIDEEGERRLRKIREQIVELRTKVVSAGGARGQQEQP